MVSLKIRGCTSFVLALCLGGCLSPVHQGYHPEALRQAKLHLGMSPQQVTDALGPPSVIEPYHPQHWYHCALTGRHPNLHGTCLSLVFDHQRLASIGQVAIRSNLASLGSKRRGA